MPWYIGRVGRLLQRVANTLTFESVSVHRALRGVPRSGLWSEWAGTLLSRIPEMNQECPRRAERQRAGARSRAFANGEPRPAEIRSGRGRAPRGSMRRAR